MSPIFDVVIFNFPDCIALHLFPFCCEPFGRLNDQRWRRIKPAMFEHPPLSRRARLLGYAGQLPQVFALILLADPQTRWIALAGGYGYAALIFSFLGGIWWGIAVSNPSAPRWIYIAAVLPSLVALAAYLPWIFGWGWPGPSLILIGLCLLVSPAIDREMSLLLRLPEDWVALRTRLSIGLGLLTLMLAAAAFGLPGAAALPSSG